MSLCPLSSVASRRPACADGEADGAQEVVGWASAKLRERGLRGWVLGGEEGGVGGLGAEGERKEDRGTRQMWGRQPPGLS